MPTSRLTKIDPREICLLKTGRVAPIHEVGNSKNAIINFYPRLRNSLNKFKTNMPTSPEGYNELYGKNLKGPNYLFLQFLPHFFQ